MLDHIRHGGRGILELIVFVSGAVLLSLEIVASRVLAPYFGNSIYVWGSLIGVFLAALSLGYAYGGRLADRRPSTAVFSSVVFAAGLLTVPIPWLAPPLLEALAASEVVPPALKPLASAVALFGVPSVVMGMVSPFAVRLRADAVGTMGTTAGNLYALSTIGSIAGTLGTSFILINHLGVRTLIQVLGFTLLVIAVLGWLAARRPLAATVGAVVTALLAIGVARTAAAAPSALVYSRDTVYHRITVWDDGPLRYLKLDNFIHTGLDRDQPRRSVYVYADYLHLPRLFVPDPRRVFLIGLGGGTIPIRWVADYPSVTMDVAEIDPEVVTAAERYFGLERGTRLRVSAEDGRQHLRRTATAYDVILIDACLIDAIPFHLATRDFFALTRARLAPGGMVAMNVIGALSGPGSKLFPAIHKTMREVFRTVYVFPVYLDKDPEPTHPRNIIVLATDEPALSREEIARRARALVADGSVSVENFVQAADNLYELPVDSAEVPVMTDDFAPVDALVRPR